MAGSKIKAVYFIERLNFFELVFSVLPFLILKGGRPEKVYYIDSSEIGLFFSSFVGKLFNFSIENSNFSMFEVKDTYGDLISLRMILKDFVNLHGNIVKRTVFEKAIQAFGSEQGHIFLKKQLLFSDLPYRENLVFRALVLIQYALWRLAKSGQDVRTIIFMRPRLWCREITDYANTVNIELVWSKSFLINGKILKLRFLRPAYRQWAKTTINYLVYEIFLKFFKPKQRNAYRALKDGHSSMGKNPLLAVEYYGQLNLDNPNMYSDLFFLRNSKISGKDIVLTFNIPLDPLDKNKMFELNKYQIKPLVLNPRASKIPFYPVYYHWSSLNYNNYAVGNSDIIEEKWVLRQIEEYRLGYEYWRRFFALNNIKLYISWYKYSGEHCLIYDALKSIGGITTIYQRSYEEFPFPGITVGSDIVFAFSKNNAQVLEKSGSKVSYHITVGYPNDSLFPFLKQEASKIRDSLKKKGAKYIISFFDENCREDPRWDAFEYYVSRNYEFLLRKVLADSELGLILKPKMPISLKRRLPLVSELITKAEGTGRCFIFDAGILSGSYPPAIAALASDIAVHGHMFAATAGMESALAGVPALLLDGEGCSYSKWYRLGKGKVVFTDWNSLWKACQDYRKSSENIPGFGDWSPLLNEIDPFRDGRASERIGTYLKWLLDGFKNNLPRDKILAEAAERYAKLWGKDKITQINV